VQPISFVQHRHPQAPCDADIEVTWALFILKRHLKGRGLLKAYKAHNLCIPWQCGTLNTPPHVWHLLVKHVFNIEREGPTLSKGLWLWYHIEVTWTLLILKRHLKGRCLFKAYKAHNLGIPWQCGTLNSQVHNYRHHRWPTSPEEVTFFSFIYLFFFYDLEFRYISLF